MDSSERYKSTVAFTDLLFNVLVGFVFLFVIAFLLINPIAKKGDIITPAEYIIVMTWPDKSEDDIDLWVTDSNGYRVGFQQKDQGLMHLERDDLGTSNDTITVNGKEVITYINREVVSIRGKQLSDYNIAIHVYRRSWKNGEQSTDEMPITIEVIKINPYSVIYKQTQIINQAGQVKNFYSFSVDENNNVPRIYENSERVVPVMGFINNATTNSFVGPNGERIRIP
jgi:hypothetical protein